MGYRRQVDRLEGAALEVILLSSMANHYGYPATLFRRLMARHHDLAKLYQFVMVTRKATLRSQDYAD